MRATLAAALLALACGAGPNGPGGDDPDATCGNRGLEHFWNLSHGVPPDIDGPPAPGGGWLLYSDPIVPLFTFLYPPDWTATELRDDWSFGAHVAAAGDVSFWERLYIVYPRADLTVAEMLEVLVDATTGPDATVACEDAWDHSGAIGADSGLVALRDGDRIVWIGVGRLYDNGSLGYGVGTTVQVTYDVFAAPADVYAQTVEEVFLPIVFQFYYGGGDEEPDSDGDGVPDDEDEYPYDPTRS